MENTVNPKNPATDFSQKGAQKTGPISMHTAFDEIVRLIAAARQSVARAVNIELIEASALPTANTSKKTVGARDPWKS
ncbi:MAG: hypothetical protein MUC50_03205 [Myxococcota bacterium]|jgi:hypothetical protein|nr:hypothetical protein [Myxococcota bacterium]